MTQTPIDLSVFAELQDTVGADFVAELVATFLDEAPGMMADLQSACDAGDADHFRRAAHSIKSNANVFGATDLAETARAMELDGLGNDDEDKLVALKATCERALAALKDLTHDA